MRELKRLVLIKTNRKGLTMKTFMWIYVLSQIITIGTRWYNLSKNEYPRIMTYTPTPGEDTFLMIVGISFLVWAGCLLFNLY